MILVKSTWGESEKIRCALQQRLCCHRFLIQKNLQFCSEKVFEVPVASFSRGSKGHLARFMCQTFPSPDFFLQRLEEKLLECFRLEFQRCLFDAVILTLSQEDEEDVWGDDLNGKWKSQSFASKKLEKIPSKFGWFGVAFFFWGWISGKSSGWFFASWLSQFVLRDEISTQCRFGGIPWAQEMIR